MCFREVRIEVLEMAEEAEGGVGGAAGMKKDCVVLVRYVIVLTGGYGKTYREACYRCDD